MSGFEIVGIIIGGIPLAFEAYDRYWAVSKAFSTFRNHSNELDKLDTILKTQKTLFRSNVIKVLTIVSDDPSVVRSLVSGDGNCTWQDLRLKPTLQNVLEDSLKESFKSWEENLEQIRRTLLSICTEIDEFRSSCPSNTDKVSMLQFRRLPFADLF